MIGTIANKTDALYSLAPTSKWSITGDVINWYDEDDTVPTDAELAAEITRLQGVYDNAEYQRTRAAANRLYFNRRTKGKRSTIYQ